MAGELRPQEARGEALPAGGAPRGPLVSGRDGAAAGAARLGARDEPWRQPAVAARALPGRTGRPPAVPPAGPRDGRGVPSIGPEEQYRRLRQLVDKRQVRLILDARGVDTFYRQRARVEPDLYLSILAIAYARALALLLGGTAAVLAVRGHGAAPEVAATALVLGLGAALARWRQQRGWMRAVRTRLLADSHFFVQAYEDGLFMLRRGRRECRFPRPWTAILGLEAGAARDEPAVTVRAAAGAGAAAEVHTPPLPRHSRPPSGVERAMSPNCWESAWRRARAARPPG